MRFFLFLFLLISANVCYANDDLIDIYHCLPQDIKNLQCLHFSTTRSPEGPLKKSLLNQLKTLFSIEAFIESGTLYGDTTALAGEIFNEVHSIELEPNLYARAQKRFENDSHISIHWGSSEDVLLNLLPQIKKKTLFYLDGHYSGSITARGFSDAPIIQELHAIRDAGKWDSVILIDDIRLFQKSSFPEKLKTLNLGLETYVELPQILQALFEINPDYQICFPGDTILAFPREDSVSVSPLLKACSLHRLAAYYSFSDEELKNAAQVIRHAESEEKAQIASYFHTYAPFELEYGYRCYGCYWYALILENEDYQEEATYLFKKAAENSLPNWELIR